MIDRELALKLIEGKPWHHDFEIIPGVRTHGSYNPEGLWNNLQLPQDMTGLSLADIGASNGYFSFAARRRGARVVAFDFRHKDNSGFGLAQYINGLSDIEHHYINVLDISKEKFGQFDIVLALGLLYHVSDPYKALANCAELSQECILVESYCINSHLSEALATEPIMTFISDPKRFPDLSQPNADRSNFWGSTDICLKRMLEDIGFSVSTINVHSDRVLIDARRIEFDNKKTRLTTVYELVKHRKLRGRPTDPNAWIIIKDLCYSRL